VPVDANDDEVPPLLLPDPALFAGDACPSTFAMAAADISPQAFERGREDVGDPTFTICS
jgi:hypothetical protein